MYCTTKEQDYDASDTRLKFGHSFTHEFQCNLESIIRSDMFFYDMYLVDMYCDDNINGSDCLYPVPILNRNFLERKNFLPNRNKFFGDEINDKYSRRFFLFDNLVSLLCNLWWNYIKNICEPNYKIFFCETWYFLR